MYQPICVNNSSYWYSWCPYVSISLNPLYFGYYLYVKNYLMVMPRYPSGNVCQRIYIRQICHCSRSMRPCFPFVVNLSLRCYDNKLMLKTIAAILHLSCFWCEFATMCSNFFDVITHSPKASQLIPLLLALFFVCFEELAMNNRELPAKFLQRNYEN